MKKVIRSGKKFINIKKFLLSEKTVTIIVGIVAVIGGLIMFRLRDLPQNKDMHEVYMVWGILLFELAFFAFFYGYDVTED